MHKKTGHVIQRIDNAEIPLCLAKSCMKEDAITFYQVEAFSTPFSSRFLTFHYEQLTVQLDI